MRFDGHCLGAACGAVVTAEGAVVSAPVTLRLATANDVQIRLASGG